MKVVVAGLYKTGTKSMKEALEILGYDVWDVSEQLNHAGGVEQWEKLLNKSGDTKPLLAKMLAHCEAVTDGPAAVLSAEIFKTFPTCKVILCVRDNEDVWFESYRRNRDTLNGNFLLRFMRLVSPTVARRFDLMKLVNDAISCGRFVNSLPSFNPRGISPLLCKRAYLAHIAHLKSVVPPNQLLVFNVKEGWVPICPFLEKEVPQVQFPHANRNSSNATSSGVYRYAMFSSVKAVRKQVAIELIIALFTAFVTFLAVLIVFLLK
uniref:Sulfotransferase n=1 Tax=Ciona savignyi TaxID=51511 RepID=H2YF19_CIOSA